MPTPFSLQFLLATFAGWVHREQAQAVADLLEENRVLREQLGNRRLRLTTSPSSRLTGGSWPSRIRSARDATRSCGESSLRKRPPRSAAAGPRWWASHDAYA